MDKPFYKPPNARHKGNILSEDFNRNFNDLKLNLNTLISKSNENNNLITTKVTELIEERKNLELEINYLKEKIEIIKEV